MRSEKSIKLEIHGKNELNRIAGIELRNILPQLEKYLNTKIVTLKGFTKKFVIEYIKPIPAPMENGFASLHYCHLTTSSNTLKLSISICLNGGSTNDNSYYCQYFDRVYFVGDIENHVLTKIDKIEDTYTQKRIDFDAEMAKIYEYYDLKKGIQLLKSIIKIDNID